jgi:hypothetical protein
MGCRRPGKTNGKHESEGDGSKNRRIPHCY